MNPKLVLGLPDFKESAPWPILSSSCDVHLSVCPVNFKASHWPLHPGPLISGPGTNIRATIRHYYLRTTICATIRATIRALPSGHYHLRTTICCSTR